MDSSASLQQQDASLALRADGAEALPSPPCEPPASGGMPGGMVAAAAAAAALAACGGGVADMPATRADAARFLEQATFGPTDAEIDRLMTLGYSAWLDDQMNPEARPQVLLRTYWDERDALAKETDELGAAQPSQVLEAFWQNAVAGDTQLRDRVSFALSEIFVVSLVDGTIAENSRLMVGYYDMLAERCFGTYRNLLEGVALSPAMGIYLSHLKNQKEDANGRVPDQNFAREVMQLFSIGLYKLMMDATPELDANGKPVETYTPDDIKGLSRVFTGFSWAGSPKTDGRFLGSQQYQDPDRFVVPMEPYPKFHSVLEKKFLGVTIAAQSTADPAGDLKIALDTLAAHKNVAPFICKQLIQRLVTSNPTPAYVARVALAFAMNDGNLAQTVRAILLDAEARDAAQTAIPSFGKLREPVLRFTHLLRAFGAKSDSGRFVLGDLSDPSALGQAPMRAPSVFNYFRPGYVPPGTFAAGLGLVMPEMQIANESSVAGYANFVIDGLRDGFGNWSAENTAGINRPDVQFTFTEKSADSAFVPSAERLAADEPPKLAELVNQRLLYGRMSTALRTDIEQTVATIVIPPFNIDGSNLHLLEMARRHRVMTAIAMVAVSPEYLVQK